MGESSPNDDTGATHRTQGSFPPSPSPACVPDGVKRPERDSGGMGQPTLEERLLSDPPTEELLAKKGAASPPEEVGAEPGLAPVPGPALPPAAVLPEGPAGEGPAAEDEEAAGAAAAAMAKASAAKATAAEADAAAVAAESPPRGPA